MRTVSTMLRRTALVLTAVFTCGGLLFALGYAFEDPGGGRAVLLATAVAVPLAALTVLASLRHRLALRVLALAVGLYAVWGVIALVVDLVEAPDLPMIGLILALPIAVVGLTYALLVPAGWRAGPWTGAPPRAPGRGAAHEGVVRPTRRHCCGRSHMTKGLVGGDVLALHQALRMVGVTGFEPATSSSRTKRATKLRHTPVLHLPWSVDRRQQAEMLAQPPVHLRIGSRSRTGCRVRCRADPGVAAALRAGDERQERGLGTAGEAYGSGGRRAEPCRHLEPRGTLRGV